MAAIAALGFALGPSTSGLPQTVPLAPRWTASVSAAPIGHAIACLVTTGQDRVTVIGDGDEVRVYDRPEWSNTLDDAASMMLSPDGRWLAMPHWPDEDDQRTRLLDLADGSVRVLDAGAPLAWSADGRRLLVVRFDGDATRHEPHGGELRVVGVPDGNIVWTATLAPHEDAFLALTAAFAPDGDAVAVQHGDDLDVDRRDGTGWHVRLDSHRLAGPAAWTADGALLWTMDRTGRLVARDATNGQLTGVATIPGYPGATLVGWREGAPVVVDGPVLRQLGGHAAELLRGPAATIELVVAADAVRMPLRAPGSPHFGPLLARYADPLTLAAALLILLPTTAWLLLRLRRRT